MKRAARDAERTRLEQTKLRREAAFGKMSTGATSPVCRNNLLSRRQLECNLVASQIVSTPRPRVTGDLHLNCAGQADQPSAAGTKLGIIQ